MENILKNKRLEKKMTLEQVGKLVGVGKSTVRKWENGMIENMGRDKIVALSKALDISPLDILGIPKDDSDEKLQLNSLFDKLNKTRQKNVLDFAKIQLERQAFDNDKLINLKHFSRENARRYTPVEAIERVSAGFGFHYGENQKEVYYTLRKDLPRFDFATVVVGDSMEPTLHDGDVVLIRQSYDTPQGGIYIVDYDETSWVKEVTLDEEEGVLILHSTNPKYRDRYLPVPAEDGEYWNIVGEVVDWFTPELI